MHHGRNDKASAANEVRYHSEICEQQSHGDNNQIAFTPRGPQMKREIVYMVITATGFRAGSCVGNEIQTSEQAVGNVQGERL